MSTLGLLSKGITLGHAATSEGPYTDMPNLQEIPDMGGSAENVEVSTLKDGARKYIRGIKDYGELEFTFLYDGNQPAASSAYKMAKAIEDAYEDTPDAVTYFEVAIPDGTKFKFSGQISTTISGAGVNDALTFTLTISLNSDMVVTTTE